MKLGSKIALTYIGLTGIGIALVSLLLSWQIGNSLDRRITEEVYEKLDALVLLFRNGVLALDITESEEDELDRLAGTLDVRITLIQKSGHVFYDSAVDRDSVEWMQNHAQRPEVVQARRGERGIDRRKS